jgi:hypothetical protein
MEPTGRRSLFLFKGVKICDHTNNHGYYKEYDTPHYIPCLKNYLDYPARPYCSFEVSCINFSFKILRAR